MLGYKKFCLAVWSCSKFFLLIFARKINLCPIWTEKNFFSATRMAQKNYFRVQNDQEKLFTAQNGRKNLFYDPKWPRKSI